MKRKRFLFLLLLVIAGTLLGVIGVSALAGYSLDWWTVDGGGATSSTGGNYSLGGSIGQPDAGTSNGGNYTLVGGFWGGGGDLEPLGAFNKTSPANGATGQALSLTLSWGASSGATSYEYCYDTSDDNACSSWVSTGTTASANLSGLSTSTTYYWQVRANNAIGTTYANGSSTVYWSFTTAATDTTFPDVPISHWAYSWIERLYASGITNGCSASPLMYCPEDSVTRAQMAIFLERGMHGSTYTPPVGTGTVFVDVPLSYWADNWIEKFYADGITNGCSLSPLAYCPDAPVTRAQMAIFLLRAKHGATYTPPAVGASTGFNDVSTSYWDAAWIKQLAAEGITNGCGSGNYCPENSVTRAEMAKFLVITFNLP